MKRSTLKLLILILWILVLGGMLVYILKNEEKQIKIDQINHQSTPTPNPSHTPQPTPTPTPLSFEEMSSLYGPCTKGSVLMYHHVENLDQAKAEGHAGLTVSDTAFRSHMEYLRDRGYTVSRMQELIDFFDSGTAIGYRVYLTFDDAYDDFYEYAYPVLKEFNYPATVFVPTGLIDNPGYLSWNQIQEMSASGLILFANHTWSHRNVGVSYDELDREITTAQTQLADHGTGNPKIFAYPYGFENSSAVNYFASNGFQLAFTTKSGTILCKGQRLFLPRIRVGSAPLSYYGF